MIAPDLIEDLELPLGRLEPLEGIPIEDDREFALRVGMEFLHRIEAAL